MAEQESFQLKGSAPQIYENQKIPALFRPLAELTLRHTDVPEGSRVIDIACGTGIVGRLAAEKAGRSGSVVGVDLNAGMIEVARQYPPARGAAMELHQGDVAALPFPDASFDIAFCQQGLQFFPDKLVALKEMRRVLAPGGTLTLTVWSSVPPWGIAIAGGLTRHVGAEAAKQSLGPFTFNDPDVIHGLLAEAGFSNIQMEILVVDRRIGPAEISIPEEMASAAYAADVARLDIATRTAMVKEIGEALGKYRVDDGFAMPQETHLIRGTA